MCLNYPPINIEISSLTFISLISSHPSELPISSIKKNIGKITLYSPVICLKNILPICGLKIDTLPI